MESLKKIVQKTRLAACILVSNFNNPFGSLMPEEHKKEAVKLLEKYNIPLLKMIFMATCILEKRDLLVVNI